MSIILKFLLRALLLAAGLVFALSLLVVMTVLMALWGVRALWCKLTGQPVNPFAMRMGPRAGFDQVFKQAERGTNSMRKVPVGGMDDVTDVQARDIK